MLVISRKVGERIVIGPDITLTVLEVRGNTIKLGCEAPASVSISRPEANRKGRNPETIGAAVGPMLSCGYEGVHSVLDASSIG